MKLALTLFATLATSLAARAQVPNPKVAELRPRCEARAGAAVCYELGFELMKSRLVKDRKEALRYFKMACSIGRPTPCSTVEAKLATKQFRDSNQRSVASKPSGLSVGGKPTKKTH